MLLDGPFGQRTERLEGRPDLLVPEELAAGYQTLWVRASIGRIFGIAPPTPLGKRCLLDAAFLAILHSRGGDFLMVYPFVCTDSDGDDPVDYDWFDTTVGLAFPEGDSPGSVIGRRLAGSFWELLLSAPHDLATFGDYDESHDDHCRVGCDGQCLFCDSIRSRSDWAVSSTDILGVGLGCSWACPDCEGEGIELFAGMIEQACDTCHGSGVITWVEDATD